VVRGVGLYAGDDAGAQRDAGVFDSCNRNVFGIRGDYHRGGSRCVAIEDAQLVSTADLVVGLDYFGSRYFSGAMGRFTSPDEPFADQDENDPQSWNLYSYVRNNPLRFTDPHGRECVTLDNGTFGDNGKGSVCQAVLDADKQKRSDITVTGQGGDVFTAFGINAFLALSNTANDFFRPLTNAMGVRPSYMQNIPTSNSAVAELPRQVCFSALSLLGPGEHLAAQFG
jgi:RHS repeat-associated protein